MEHSNGSTVKQVHFWLKFLVVLVSAIVAGGVAGSRVFGLQTIDQAEKGKADIVIELNKKEDKEHAKEVADQLNKRLDRIEADVSYQSQSVDVLNYNMARVAGALDVGRIRRAPSRPVKVKP